MGFLEDFEASLEALPSSLQRVQRQNDQRCEREIEEIRKAVVAGNIAPNSPQVKFSDEVLDEQKHCNRISDEKVTLAIQAYNLVDAHIQQLDQHMRKLEELRQEREAAAADGGSSLNNDLSMRSGGHMEGGRGTRKKTRLATGAVTEHPPPLDLDLPVDPNEPTYCLCNQISFGEMVACDNEDCKIEWFHYACVGVKEKPKGKWYCPNCIGMQKRQKRKMKQS